MALKYVSTAGSNAAAGDIGTPWQTIGYGLSQITAGDTLYLRAGTFTGSANVIDSQSIYAVPSGTSFVNAVTVSGYPSESVTIRPPYNVSGIRLTTGLPSYLIFQDFTIDMSNGDVATDADGIFLGGGHHCRFQRLEVENCSVNGVHTGSEAPGGSGSNEFLDCYIHHNGGSVGQRHGLYISSSNNLFDGNEVAYNGGYGFHIYGNTLLPSHADPSRNVVRNNYVHHNGQGAQGSSAGILLAWGDSNVAYNNLVVLNYFVGLQGYTFSTNAQFYNNTVYGNGANGIELNYYASPPIVRNNISFGNGVDLQDYPGLGVIDHNLIGINPRFVNAATGDFSLLSDSPAINTGATVLSVTTDYDGTARPQGAAYDIGAFEATSAGGGGGTGQVTLDAVTDNGVTTTAGETISHTCTGSNRHLVVTVHANGTTVSSLTYNGSSLTQRGTATNDQNLVTEVWDLVAPTAGTHDVVLVLGSSQEHAVVIASFTGVHQTTPIGTVVADGYTGSGITHTHNTTSETGGVVWDALAAKLGAGTLTIASGQTLRGSGSGTDIEYVASTAPGALTVTSGASWVNDFFRWSHATVPLTPATVAATSSTASLLLLGIG